MKKIVIFMLAAVLALPTFAQGQPAPRQQAECRLNLTEQQKTQIEQIRAAHRTEMETCRLDMDILRAEYRKLLATGAAEKEINAKIDEMTTLQNKRMKTVSKMRLEIRKLLTEEQIAVFDQMSSRRYCKEGYHRGQGQYRGQGKYPGHGYGYHCPR